MELIYNKALAVSSSNKVLFFKIGYDPMQDRWCWMKYFEINIRGQIYFIKGNERIQITSDRLVYFYLIDKETLIPVLENVMYNYMECSQMMIGAAKRFSVTYTSNQR